MTVKLKTISVQSDKAVQFINITAQVHEFVGESGIQNGLLAVITSHTTTGILVQESLECVESDMESTLALLAPDDLPYAHAHFLRSYGATGNNSPGHLKSMLTGNHCLFPVLDGKVVCGCAQDIYLAEFDGPQARQVYIEVMGE
jgi:secondary thiamine-phosphate synthase enzyme